MEMLEAIAVTFINEETFKCPFKEDLSGSDSFEAEDTKNDDKIQQPNQADKLATNMKNATPGSAGTFNDIYPAPEFSKKSHNDTARAKAKGGKLKAIVSGAGDIKSKEVGFTVAAHHLIPGNAALYNKKNDLTPYLGPKVDDDGKKTGDSTVVTDAGNKFNIKKFVGYNVNGCHNGVWLPGSYYIKAYKPATDKKAEQLNKSPIGGPKEGVNWGDMQEAGHGDWQLNYVAAVTKVANGQFHDTHTEYSSEVLRVLNKIAFALMEHQDNCKECKSKKTIPPAFMVKIRLYAMSRWLKKQVTSYPSEWRAPYFASDTWRDIVFTSDKTMYKKFLSSWLDARTSRD